MGLSNIVDQLHDQDGLSDPSTSEQSNLASLLVGSQQVNNLHISKINQNQACHYGVSYQIRRRVLMAYLPSWKTFT
jgi:hypothetical protein